MKQRKKDAPVERVETPSFTDPQGSWTGVPLDPFEEPVQDADDLMILEAPSYRGGPRLSKTINAVLQ